MTNKELKLHLGIAYKQGYLDGYNFKADELGEEEVDMEEFNTFGVADCIDEAIEKLLKE